MAAPSLILNPFDSEPSACISTDVTGIPEIVRHGVTGLLVAQADVPALAGAMNRLLADPLLRVNLAKRARELVETDFEIHSNAAQLRKLFGAAAQPMAAPM